MRKITTIIAAAGLLSLAALFGLAGPARAVDEVNECPAAVGNFADPWLLVLRTHRMVPIGRAHNQDVLVLRFAENLLIETGVVSRRLFHGDPGAFHAGHAYAPVTRLIRIRAGETTRLFVDLRLDGLETEKN